MSVGQAADPPTIDRQKSYILEQAGILNPATKKTILSIVMMEVGQSAVENPTGTTVMGIDLDVVGSKDETVLSLIYNLVRSRVEHLDTSDPKSAHPDITLPDAPETKEQKQTFTAAATLPSISRQKSYILEHAGVLNPATKKTILSIVMMEIGKKSAILETGGTKEVDIDLDAVASMDETVLGYIYNIVKARLETLNQPARAGETE